MAKTKKRDPLETIEVMRTDILLLLHDFLNLSVGDQVGDFVDAFFEKKQKEKESHA